MVKRIIKRYLDWRHKCRIWKKHGNHTKYHLTGETFDIGEWTYGVPTIHQYDNETKLKIGKFCSIAAGVQIVLGGNHHTNWVSTYAFYQENQEFTKWGGEVNDKRYKLRGDIIIGNDVWIGRNAMILSGANIGDGAVIGAGAVVAGTIPPYAIAIGNPAKVIKYRFPSEQIEKLLSIKWWDWSTKKIDEQLPLICSPQIDDFIESVINNS